ncbi:MAG TPA: HEAT repeat domain-containing protein [Isosphaeraceae bacterium]|nr:HEAT repeat domain-containing protein [Isosphaeraceae bacterium]
MRGWFRTGLALAAWLAPTAGFGQVIERDTTITGPGGRSINRDVRIQRSPGMVERDITIRRPAGTFQRDTRIMTAPAGGPRFGPPVGGFRPGWGGGWGWGPRFVPGPVVINNGPSLGTDLAIGGASFVGGMLLGSVLRPAPPPVVVAQPVPVVAATAPVVVAPPAVVAQPAPAPAFDPFADAFGRLKSAHGNSRRDGALTLGQLGDARAVPALVDRLKNDYSSEVRVASAWALGAIGDPRAGVALERASLFDRRREVRDAATTAYRRLPRANATAAPASTATAGRSTPTRPTGPSATPTPPALAARPAPDRPRTLSDTPPPPPTPVDPSEGSDLPR